MKAGVVEVVHGDLPITSPQIEFVKRLCDSGFLIIEDFPSSREFYRKKNLTRGKADELIKLGRIRRDNWKASHS